MSHDDDFTEYVTARWDRLYRLAYLLAGSRSEAEDLLQDALERAYPRWSSIAEAGSPDAYVRRLMVNTLVSRYRRRARRPEVAHAEVPDPGVLGQEPSVLDHLTVWPLVCALAPRQRAVIVLRYYEDLSERQIAEVLRCSTGSVKSQAHDALASLRRAVEAAGRPLDANGGEHPAPSVRADGGTGGGVGTHEPGARAAAHPADRPTGPAGFLTLTNDPEVRGR